MVYDGAAGATAEQKRGQRPIIYHGADGMLHATDGDLVGTAAERKYVRGKFITDTRPGGVLDLLHPCGDKYFFENPTAYLLWTGNKLPERYLQTFLQRHGLPPGWDYTIHPAAFRNWYARRNQTRTAADRAGPARPPPPSLDCEQIWHATWRQEEVF